MKRRNVFKLLSILAFTPMTALGVLSKLKKNWPYVPYDMMDTDPLISGLLDEYTDKICMKAGWGDFEKWRHIRNVLKYGYGTDTSILRKVIRTWKQKVLLEDAYLIHGTGRNGIIKQEQIQSDIKYLEHKIQAALTTDRRKFLDNYFRIRKIMENQK